ncbi:hypothetical protein P389DRAFT_105518 [Cystobasidium minutum MCA 4210]|uniref:uncharacterized protein n=1 Tax=Cystobasidium minutum MCA 4210 TaxID=1397322 RepID=UPI0034CD07AF|eukprot:jgi/Rhomi1/105518/CE105517_1209
MTSRTSFQQASLLRFAVSRQSIRQPLRKKNHFTVRSLHSHSATSYSHRSGTSFLNGYSTLAAAGIAVSTLALCLQHNGIQVQLLSNAKADEPITPYAALDESPVHLDPDTSIPFPATIKPIESSSGDLKLIGLGVRTVSFLRVKVYSAGAYFLEKALDGLKGRGQLLQEGQGEKLVAYILDQPYDVAVRIVPTRNTDHSHLRDGFVRAMLARMKQATSSKQITDEQAEAAGKDLDDFKGFFPSGKVSKGKYMMLTRRGSDGALLLEYEGKLLGTLRNGFLSKQMLLAYFADNDKEISAKLKNDVITGLERYL